MGGKKDFVRAKIISIGDELLIGQVVNTNASWIGNMLTTNGFKVDAVLTVGDGEEEIIGALDVCSDADVVIMTGGLGPTADDRTKQTLCGYFNTELEFNREVYDNMMGIFALRGYVMSERNKGQAYVPKSCKCIVNHYGTAPCMWFEKSGSVFISMPGVPFEMRHSFEEEILPMLLSVFRITPYMSKVIMVTGIGESFLADKIQDWEESLPDFLSLAYLPKSGMVRLRLDGRHDDRELLRDTINKEVEKLVEIVGENIYGFDDAPLSKIVIEALRSKGLTLATAESCTGGNIASMITSNAGCSDVYKGTVVSYATEVKENVLGVNHDIVERFGVVSCEVAEQMAVGARRVMNTDYGLSTTGLAGPGGGTDAVPVGTVCIAVAGPNGVVSRRHSFGKDREYNIERASIMALNMLRNELAL
ncbi:MAG: competence/damage-inducible protein A [Candidatus Limimorpha sp.]